MSELFFDHDKRLRDNVVDAALKLREITHTPPGELGLRKTELQREAQLNLEEATSHLHNHLAKPKPDLWAEITKLLERYDLFADRMEMKPNEFGQIVMTLTARQPVRVDGALK